MIAQRSVAFFRQLWFENAWRLNFVSCFAKALPHPWPSDPQLAVTWLSFSAEVINLQHLSDSGYFGVHSHCRILLRSIVRSRLVRLVIVAVELTYLKPSKWR